MSLESQAPFPRGEEPLSQDSSAPYSAFVPPASRGVRPHRIVEPPREVEAERLGRIAVGTAPAVPPGERGDALALLRWTVERFGERVALVSSLGPQTLVVLDLLHRAGLQVTVLFIDTDLHFALTYALRREVERRYGIEVVNLRTDLDLADQARLYGEALWERDPDLCCKLRKVDPLRRGLEGYDAWITGLRRGHGGARGDTEAVEWDGIFGRVKVNPLARWTREEVNAYLDEHRVPYNPLLDDGYASIGCSPCTQRVDGRADERAGRWAGREKTECGLHGGRPLRREERA